MKVLIRAGKIVDGTGAEPIQKGAILISDKKILEVGSQTEVKVESGTQVLDAGNKTVIPGLIDCHGHLFGIYHKWTHQNYAAQEITKTAILAVKNAERCVKAGVLTVRDAGCSHLGIFEMRSAISSAQILGPRLLVSGQPITTTGGHSWDSSLEVDGAGEARGAVRNMLRWGADCIKFMVTGGSSTQYEEITDVQLTLDELAAGVEEAKKRHRLTLAHANNSEGAMLCVQAGVNSIDHGNILNKEALDAMKKAGSFYVPTMYCYVATATNGPKVGVPEWEVEKSRQILDVHRESFQRAYRMGINIATGTDLGPEARGGPVAVLGEGLIAEMELMAEYGMTPADTIKAATCVSARNLGIDQSTGTLQEGKLADLVIIDGDPLDDIGNLRRVWRVMKEGRIVYEA